MRVSTGQCVAIRRGWRRHSSCVCSTDCDSGLSPPVEGRLTTCTTDTSQRVSPVWHHHHRRRRRSSSISTPSGRGSSFSTWLSSGWPKFKTPLPRSCIPDPWNIRAGFFLTSAQRSGSFIVLKMPTLPALTHGHFDRFCKSSWERTKTLSCATLQSTK